MVYSIHIFMVFFVLFETTRLLLQMDFDYDDLFYRLFTDVPDHPFMTVRLSGVQGLNDTLFNKCVLKSNPTWTDEMRQLLNPNYDPLKKCDRSYRSWSSLNADGRVTIESEYSDAECRARALRHKSDFENNLGMWHKIEEKFEFETDIIEVECTRAGKVAYKFLHSQIWTGNQSISSEPEIKKNKIKPPSIYIILMDSFGASHAKRVFPKTLQYLKDTFDSVEMHHLNKACHPNIPVGENSRPNAFPFLMGKTMQGIYKDLFGIPNVQPDLTRKQYCEDYLDHQPLIMKQFEKLGYKTMLAEDWAQGVFNWPNCKGFERPPTTHYMRPFQLAMATPSRQLLEHQAKANCFEPHHFLNQYMEQFMNAYTHSPKFALIWDSSLGHDYSNEPFHADQDYVEFFSRNKEKLDNSFLFFMGDHGLRFGKMSDTPEGRRDISNPMMHISVPRRLRSNSALMSNLKKNSNELLTMFDVHATFVDILETFTTAEKSDFTQTVQMENLRGTSLLRPLPPAERHCKTLPIPFQYCICNLEKQPVQITEEFSAIGHVIADSINKQLSTFKLQESCDELQHDEITELKLVMGTSDLYQATVRLKPSLGLYRTYVRGWKGHFSVASPDVSRMDSYGSQANCIDNNEIRPLCYCKRNRVPMRFFFGTFLD